MVVPPLPKRLSIYREGIPVVSKTGKDPKADLRGS